MDLPGRHRRVVIVDDNRDLAVGFGRLLKLSGFVVEMAFDGRTGLELALACQPHVALLNLWLPKLGGFQVAERIRGERGMESVILIAVTGFTPDLLQAHQRALFDHHLVKPVGIVTLLATLEKAF